MCYYIHQVYALVSNHNDATLPNRKFKLYKNNVYFGSK
jgi:hypothetical protein